MKYINWGLNQPPILNRLESLGYKIFTQVEYDLNIIGIRNSSRRPGLFDDEICVCYKEGFDWIEERYKATTDPSMEQHLNPNHKTGVAIMKPGQYRGLYKYGKHRGQYDALVLTGNSVKFFRDNNLNDQTGYINEAKGYIGLNLHRAHPNKIAQSTRAYSHGCQVIQSPADYARLMGLCRMQIGIGYKTFTYTLIEATDEELD